MDQRTNDSAWELVLDNRKVIIAFALLIALCGTFFIVGFIEGKRQGRQGAAQVAAEAAYAESGIQVPPEETSSAVGASESKPLEESLSQDQLEWFDRTRGQQAGSSNIEEKKLDAIPASEAAKPLPEVKSADKPENKAEQTAKETSTRVTYSVQVGAFKQRREAEATAKVLISKGYDCRIEAPLPPDKYFYLKVGKFNSRPEAHVMELRLEKDGFDSFIKTN